MMKPNDLRCSMLVWLTTSSGTLLRIRAAEVMFCTLIHFLFYSHYKLQGVPRFQSRQRKGELLDKPRKDR